MNRSLFQAFVIAPLVAPILFITGDILLTITGISAKHDLVGMALAVFFFTTPVSYLATAVFGIPYYFFLKKLDRITIVNMIIGGAIFGIVTLTLYFAWIIPVIAWRLSDLLWILGVGAILGLSVAWCFYILSET